jgi:5-methylthioadenosine/S-adenosylhomocysteine deaminase
MPESGRLLITGGTVVSMDPAVGDLRRGDVLIEDGMISEVAPVIEAPGCETLDATDMIVMPGLVDPHRHLWYSAVRGLGMDTTLQGLIEGLWPKLAANYTPEDLYVAQRAGAVDALQHGVTTVVDWCHVINTPEHAPEAVRALREIPLRTVFAYGPSMRRKLQEFEGKLEHHESWEPVRRMRETELSSDEDRVTMAMAIQGPESSFGRGSPGAEATALENAREEVSVARELGVPMTMHIGLPGGPPPQRAIAALAGADLLGADMQFAHCCTTTEDEFRLVADAGAKAVACPMVAIGMGLGEPPVARMRDADVPIAVGADAVCGASGDLFEEARSALLFERARHARRWFSEGQEIDDLAQLGMTAREALEAITINAAHASWLGDRVGSLSPGKAADVILLRGTDLNMSPLSDVVGMLVSSAHGSNVDTVVVDGKVVKRDGVLVGIDVARVRADLLECRDRLFAAGDFKGMLPPALEPSTA